MVMSKTEREAPLGQEKTGSALSLKSFKDPQRTWSVPDPICIECQKIPVE